MNYYSSFIEEAYKNKQIMESQEWFESYGLALYLFSENAVDTPSISKSAKVKKYQKKELDKNNKSIGPVVKVEDVRQLIAKARSEDSFNSIYENYMFPHHKIRPTDVIYLFKALAQKDMDAALVALDAFSDDFLLQNDFWAGIVTFIVAANSGDYKIAQTQIVLLIQFLQSYSHKEFLFFLVPYLVKSFLPESYWPWQFKNIEVESNGIIYYGLPIIIHNLEAEGYSATPWLELEPVSSIYLEDSYGAKYKKSNVLLETTNIASNLAANAVLQSAGAIYNMIVNGKFKIVAHSGVKTLVLQKNVEIPLNSCGFVITNDKHEFDNWVNPNNSSSIEKHQSFFNLTDGKCYQPRSKDQFSDPSAMFDALASKIKG